MTTAFAKSGEDAAIVVLSLENGSNAILDMSGYNENKADNPHYTFAELLAIDTEGGTLRLFADGNIEVQLLGKPAFIH